MEPWLSLLQGVFGAGSCWVLVLGCGGTQETSLPVLLRAVWVTAVTLELGGVKLLQRQSLSPETERGGLVEAVVLCLGWFLIFDVGKGDRATLGSALTRLKRGGGPGAGAAPRVWLWSGWEQMAPDPRVPAAAAAPRERPASVRRGGWTGQGVGTAKSILPGPKSQT